MENETPEWEEEIENMLGRILEQNIQYYCRRNDTPVKQLTAGIGKFEEMIRRIRTQIAAAEQRGRDAERREMRGKMPKKRTLKHKGFCVDSQDGCDKCGQEIEDESWNSCLAQVNEILTKD